MATVPEELRGRWVPDILGSPFESLTLPLTADWQGDVVATLVRRRPTRFAGLRTAFGDAAGWDVLYVHGWSDYFFQTELAEFWEGRGARFFALDLRKYGRSLRADQTPGYAASLDVYDEDLEAALTVMGHGADSENRSRRLLLMGHSTGALTLSLWADRHPGRADALVLNSPWLEFQAGAIARRAIAPLANIGARIDPGGQLPNVDLGFYSRAVSKAMDGEWEYNTDWRPARGFPAHPAWLAAVLAGHARVDEGLSITAPVLSLVSARSTLSATWSPAMLSSDIVLVVDDIAEHSLKLAPTVTVARIDGALHDVLLSRPAVRATAYAEIARWASAYLD
ncbi:alpha/beta hydrolase [Mycetocola manganoxydans]|uniref:Alpha/beta hydrolase n=1 Tax=Mycetocola manganoxydans TaxID=699879 RepID=A0A3L6ZP84_9MICO|nr:alpha/beta hydrolase [Mycetocola manganoxydans]RLP68842.1 alpha/beta hydrolase [Mycetocola manganoxydans]GHD51144.1 lysophospholipase [Mycetocola manganoxydans]